MKVVNIMPVYGRRPLLVHTISRLYRVNKVSKVICSGHMPEDKAVCEAMGAEWVQAENSPLGRKCNAALSAAQKYNPDFILISWSSDWLCENWIKTLIENIGNASLIGTPDCYFMQVYGSGEKERREFLYWGGYQKEKEPQRHNEPIGGGRIFTGEVCRKLNWNLFEDTQDHSLDWTSMHRVFDVGGKVKAVKGKDIFNMSIGTDFWPNKHSFERERKYPTSRELTEKEAERMLQIFPEAARIFNI